MRYRTLGRTGLRVSEMFLGTMTFGTDWGWGAPLDECRKLYTAFVEAGGNVIDTADKYTEGESERIVGELIKQDRDRMVVATKYTLSSDGTDPNASGNHRKNLTRAIESSLTRLATDRIDLLWVHIWDPATPIEETMRALDDAVRAGKILYVGISDTPAWVISRANTLADWRGWTPFAGVQLPYSLVQRDAERELLPMAEAMGLSVAAWSPLARGVLSGKFTRSTPTTQHTRVRAEDIDERELAIARTVDAVADELGASSSQVALAWLRAGRPNLHVVLGARRLEQLTDNLGAAELELPEDAIRRLDEASAIELGFPADFISSMGGFTYGPVGERVDFTDRA
ncbi:aryl-alcohol dehydrogenase-like predicted oxidoreductase [Krasilnikovia cinnamomea]|uniref:Aryl-alcohol dehydrogenase-like predicted oxidoreductase n=2 Tax=Krasilnikovia cinnamomea TaxID=349313 RepID=A0A4Q7ZKE0_9ACTN|nr:aryl-alcohol dehydrogenase-like predicted oxidoreductase [Krasilnikovia cinnamomea]